MAAEIAERIGARMKQRRIELRLTQAEVADRIRGKTTSDQVSRWERGKHQPQNLDPVAEALEVDVSYFYAASSSDDGGTPEPSTSSDGAIEQRLAELAEQIERDRHDRAANIADVKALLNQQNELLRRQSDILAGIEKLVATQRDAAHRLEQMTEEATRVLREQAPLAPEHPSKRTGTSRGSE